MIKPANKVYTFYGTHSPIMPAATYTVNWNLNNRNRTNSIKSIFWDLKLFDAVTFKRILTKDPDGWIMFRLNIAVPPNPVVGFPFQDFLPVGFLTFSGRGLSFFSPGQYLFNAFYIRNTVAMEFYIENFDALMSVGFEISVIVEIEEMQ
jgi:hypothetical protein